MPLSFPSSPTVGQTSTQNGRSYTYRGNNVWELTPAVDTGIGWMSAPASSTSSGTAGSIARDSDYFYIATATNTWKRVGLAAWDSDFANVVLLLHGNGSLVDSSSYGRVVTAYAGANAGGAGKFGDGSLQLSTDGDYFTVPDSESLELGSSNFTIEAWLYPTSYPSSSGGFYQSGIVSKLVGGPDHSFTFNLNGTASSFTGLVFQASDAATPGDAPSFSASASFSLNTWAHVAVVRSGNLLFFFKDGVLLNAGGTAFTINIRNGSAPVRIGRQQYDNTYVYQYFGLMDELRITKAARYTSAFTPPTGPFADA